MHLKELFDAEYLSDGAYIGHDGGQLWIVTNDGISTTNSIAFELDVGKEIIAYVERVRAKYAKEKKP